MVSHKYKLIFVNIPWIVGDVITNWMKTIDRIQKHLPLYVTLLNMPNLTGIENIMVRKSTNLTSNFHLLEILGLTYSCQKKLC